MNPAIMAAITAASNNKKEQADKATPTVEMGEGAGWAILLSLLALASLGASLIALLKYLA